MKRIIFALLVSIFTLCSVAVYAVPPALELSERMNDEWWKNRHEANKARIAEGNVDLLLIGDSITHGWDGAGAKVQEYYYGDRNYVNMGFGGDQTGHVLWRLNDAPMEKIQPKAAVLLIGINNLWVPCQQEPTDVAQGTKAIVEKLESLYPNIKILVLYTFVTGENPDSGERSRVAKENAVVLDLLRDDPHVILKDINYIWLNEANQIPKELMNDFVHPTEAGYWLWGAAVESEVSKMLGDTPKAAPENK